MLDLKKCKICKYHAHNRCSLLANVKVDMLDKCAMNYSFIRDIQPNSFEEYAVYTKKEIIAYLQYLSYQRKQDLPAVGSKVITLKSGFGSLNSGQILKVINYPNAFNMRLENPSGDVFIVDPYIWYLSLFVLED